jgi:hypothetical protein
VRELAATADAGYKVKFKMDARRCAFGKAAAAREVER